MGRTLSPSLQPPEPRGDSRAEPIGSTPLFWAGALLMLWAMRLPYFLSPSYVLDNDEAVLGLMARSLAQGRDLPLFFWGQRYGLSVFETFPAALAFRVFGDGPAVLAHAVLAVFLVGLAAWARAFSSLSGSVSWGRGLALALGLVPGWIVWSMKARGIYVSGFLLTGLALALLTRPLVRRREVVALAVLLGLLAFVHPLWLAPVLPLLLLPRLERRSDLLTGAAALLATTFTLLLLVPSGPVFWQPDIFGGFQLDAVLLVPNRLARAFMGQEAPHEPGPIAYWTGCALMAAFFVVLAALALRGFRERDRTAGIAALALVASVAPAAFMEIFPPRYLLPATALLPVGVSAWLGSRRVACTGRARLTALALTGVLWSGAAGMGLEQGVLDARLAPAERDLRELIRVLEEDGVEAVLTPHADLQWQLLFYGRERILARGRSATDRNPAYAQAVTDIRRAERPVALVADIRHLHFGLPEPTGCRVELVAQRYLRCDDPPDRLLLALRFQGVVDRLPNRVLPFR